MRSASSFVFVLAFVSACSAACATRSGPGPGVAGQSLSMGQAADRAAQARVGATSAQPPSEDSALPHLSLASLAGDPSPPADVTDVTDVTDAANAPDAPDAAIAPEANACPDDMVLVDGEYCTEVRQDCVEWMEPPSNPLARCAKFAKSVCVGERVHKRFCVDRDEYTAPGQELPQGDVSWTQAKSVCEKAEKRLCKETEWELACEGDEMLPYPTGYERDASTCNFDKSDLTDPQTGKLRDQREATSKLDRCTSPYGVRNMSGNVDEWVWRDRTWGEWRSALKGGWWMAARDRCRPATTAHDESFHELQTGVRCCADARPPAEGGG